MQLNNKLSLTHIICIFVLLISSNAIKHERALTEESIERTRVTLADTYAAVEFYFDPGLLQEVVVQSFEVTIEGSDENTKEISETLTITDIYNVEGTTEINSYAKVVWDNLIPGSYKTQYTVEYENEDGKIESEQLMKLNFNSNVSLSCTQETFGAFFSLEIYSNTGLSDEYNFCDLTFKLYKLVDVELGRAAILYEESLSLAIFVFRGTSTLDDVIQDIQVANPTSCSKVYSFDCEGDVGEGFAESYNQIKKDGASSNTDLLSALANLYSDLNINYVLLSGHSKGAAEATLALLDVLNLNLFYEIHIITFGFPSFGDQDFVDFWNSQLINYHQHLNSQNKILSTWHYHKDNDGNKDIVVAASQLIYEPVQNVSIYRDIDCPTSGFLDVDLTGDASCHSFLLYVDDDDNDSTYHGPSSGYYFVGVNPSVWNYQTDLYLSSFDPISTPITASPSPSISRTPSPSPFDRSSSSSDYSSQNTSVNNRSSSSSSHSLRQSCNILFLFFIFALQFM